MSDNSGMTPTPTRLGGELTVSESLPGLFGSCTGCEDMMNKDLVSAGGVQQQNDREDNDCVSS